MNPAERIMITLGRHLEGPAHIRLMGGGALILGYGMPRTTEDADLLLEDGELEALIQDANIGAAIEATNAELESEGLYLTHLWGPEQQILTPEWKTSCRSVERDWGTPLLSVSVLGPVDLVLSKLCRYDEGDRQDVDFLVRSQGLRLEQIEVALRRATVPEAFDEVFEANRTLLIARLSKPGHA